MLHERNGIEGPQAIADFNVMEHFGLMLGSSNPYHN